MNEYLYYIRFSSFSQTVQRKKEHCHIFEDHRSHCLGIFTRHDLTAMSGDFNFALFYERTPNFFLPRH